MVTNVPNDHSLTMQAMPMRTDKRVYQST